MWPIHILLNIEGRWHQESLHLLSQRDLSLISKAPKTLWYQRLKRNKSLFLTCFRKHPSLWSASLFSTQSRQVQPTTLKITFVSAGRDWLLLVWGWTQQCGQWEDWNIGINPEIVVAVLTVRCWHCWSSTAKPYFVTPPFILSLADSLHQARSSHLAGELYKWQRNSPSALLGKYQFSAFKKLWAC